MRLPSLPHRPLPHEWLFGGWLAVQAVALVLAAGWNSPTTWLYAACASIGPVLLVWCERSPQLWRCRVRLLWYPSAMGMAFYALPTAIREFGRPSADAVLAGWDLRLLGAPAAERLLPVTTPFATDLFFCAYLFFFVVLIAGPAHYCWRDLRLFSKNIVGLMSLWTVGFTGYVLLPAVGPYHYLAALPSLPLGPVAAAAAPAIHAASNGVDAFPSLHCAGSLYLLLFDFWHHRRRFWWWLLPVALLWVSTVYLRYHYFVDVLAAVPTALFGLAVAHWWGRQPRWPAVECALGTADAPACDIGALPRS